MPGYHVSVTDHFERFIQQQVGAGKYQNASEVLQAGLRLLEQQLQADEQKLALLKKLATDGFESLDQGQGLSLAGDEHLADAIHQIGRRAAKTVASGQQG